MACETRALVAPPVGGFTQTTCCARAFSFVKPPCENAPHREPMSHREASATRPGQMEPNYHHSDMQALLDADLSDDDADTPSFHGNNTASHPFTSNGLDQVVFSFQRQFLLSSPRRQNWPWNTTVAGVNSTETDSTAGLQTMFHEGFSGRRHLSSGSTKTVSMPHKEEDSCDTFMSRVCQEETNLKKFDETFLRKSISDNDDQDRYESFSTEELFGVTSVCDITDDETSEIPKNPCSAMSKTSESSNPTEHRQTSSNIKIEKPALLSVCMTDDRTDSDVDYGDDIRTMFGDDLDRGAEPQEVEVSHVFPTEFSELISVSSNEIELMDSSNSSLHFSDVFPDFRETEVMAEHDYNVIPTDDADSPVAMETFHEHLTHEWNNVCMTDSSVDSDSSSDTDDLDNTTDTIETYLTDSSESLELDMGRTTAAEDSISLDSTDLDNLFASPEDFEVLSGHSTDNDNVSLSDVSMTDRNSMLSLASGATTNSDSLVNENTRILFMMTDSERRPPVRWSPRYQSPMGSVNSDSLINGQNRDLFTSGNWNGSATETADNLLQTQNDAAQNDSTVDDWYVYDQRLVAELNSLRHLVDMRSYLQTQQHWDTPGIIGPPPYEECTESPSADDVVREIEGTVMPRDVPPPYTEHTESPPPNYEQLSDHGNTAEDAQQGSPQRHRHHYGINQNSVNGTLFQRQTSFELNSPSEQHEQCNNDLEDQAAESQTNDAVSDEHSNVLDLATAAQCQSNDTGRSTRASVTGSGPPSYHHPMLSLGHHLPLRWNTAASVNQWASSRMWASFRTPS